MVPAEVEGCASRYAHLSCAQAAAELSGGTDIAVPVCKHWRERGFCLFAQRCAYSHPPECLEALGREQAQLAARQAAAKSSNCVRRGGGAPGRRRKEVRNRFRASAFRRFLIDTFGRETLQQGSGVLDVAGGRGELAFELLNLNGTPATVVEPRPLDLGRRVKWLLTGFYHWNSGFAGYNDVEWPGAAAGVSSSSDTPDLPRAGAGLEQQQQQGRVGMCGEQHGGRQAGSSAAAAAAPPGAAPRMPDHLRVVVTPALAACLTGAGQRQEGSRAAGEQQQQQQQNQQQQNGCLQQQQQQRGGPPREWAALFEAARCQARRGEWLRPTPVHEAGAFDGEAAAQGDLDLEESGSSSGWSSSVRSGRSSGSSSPEPAATPPLADSPTPRRALSWTIPAEDSDSEAEGADCASWLAGRAGGCEPQAAHAQQRDPQRLPGQQATAAAAAAFASPSSPTSLQQPHSALPSRLRADPGAVAAAQAAAEAQAAAAEVAEPSAAWERFTGCSVVCGMHPDQATEFVVDLALALGKPFAVVPCCVYGRDFPRRSLGGRPVTRYEQFLQYLQAKDPAGGIRVATLPFEGRNKVLYRLP